MQVTFAENEKWKLSFQNKNINIFFHRTIINQALATLNEKSVEITPPLRKIYGYQENP